MTTKRTTRSSRRKPTGALKALVESKKAPNLLLGDLQQHAVKKAQEDQDRRQDVIHPSEMAKEDWCPRQTVYRIRGVEPSDPQKIHGYRMLTIFQEGHDIHSKWQTWLGEMGRLWGKWECRACDYTYMGLPQDECPGCMGLGLFDYKEVPLDAEDVWLIAGHADGGVPDLEAFIEIKSIGLGTIRMEEPELVRRYTVKTEDGKRVVDYDSLFKAIKRPLRSHRKQAAIYLAIARHLGWEFKRMIFIYENKANQEVKEFVVPLDEELANELIEIAKDIKWAVDKDIDLPRPTEFTRDKKPCRECPWQSWCWAGEESNDHQGSEQEQNAADGARVPRSQAKTRSAEDSDAASTERRVPRSARGSHRPQRQRTHARDDEVDQVGRVPEHPTGRGRGRRVVRRRVSGQGQGD